MTLTFSSFVTIFLPVRFSMNYCRDSSKASELSFWSTKCPSSFVFHFLFANWSTIQNFSLARSVTFFQKQYLGQKFSSLVFLSLSKSISSSFFFCYCPFGSPTILILKTNKRKGEPRPFCESVMPWIIKHSCFTPVENRPSLFKRDSHVEEEICLRFDRKKNISCSIKICSKNLTRAFSMNVVAQIRRKTWIWR